VQDVLRALAEPRRQEILELIGGREMASGEIASHFSISRPAVSQHLQVLRAAGLVHERRHGTRHFYRLRREGLLELRAYIEQFWDDALSRLADAAEEEQRRLTVTTRDGANGLDVVEREVRIAARPEVVFAFFTDPAKMVRWKGTDALLDARPGGVYRVNVTGSAIAVGEYVELVPFSRIVFTWGWEGDGHPVPPGSTTVEVSLAADGDGTLLRLRHSGLGGELAAQHADGWEHFLPRLAIVAAGGDAGPDPWVQSQHGPAGQPV
jgi:uncharacterized protein YndB with AHSA1/START domain/DNA-binding transcriptional ArsR family regulator